MKLTNKKIIAALLIAATLTGCDSLNNKAKETEEDTKVEDVTVDEKEAAKEGEEDADLNGSTEDAEGEEKDAKEGEDTEGEEDATSETEEESEAETDSGKTIEEKLEDAIFNNRVQARAAEILLEETPESLTDEFKVKLQELLEQSNDIIERSEKALEAYK